MEKIDLYEASIEKVYVDKPYNIAKTWRTIGLFINKLDAIDAVKIYEVIYRALGEKLSHSYSVQNKQFPKSLRHRYYKKYYKNLDEFINDDLNIKHYLEFNKLTADELLSQTNANDNKIKKELRIIERLIKEYNEKLHFALRTSSTSEQTIEDIKENITYLESLRDERTKLVR